MNMFKVGKWGNSLAIRIPAKLAAVMGLKEGDYVSREALALRRKPRLSREDALQIMLEAQKSSPKNLKPEDWKIDRSAADMRG